MTALELIQAIEGSGGSIRTDGPDLLIAPKELIIPLREELRRSKAEIIELLLARDHDLPVPVPVTAPLPPGVVLPDAIVVPPGVRLISWTPRELPVRLNEFTTVVAVPGVRGAELFIATTLKQIEHEMAGRHWLGGGWGGVPGLIDRLKAAGFVVEMIDEPPRPKGVAK